jgi:hypothetical protein
MLQLSLDARLILRKDEPAGVERAKRRLIGPAKRITVGAQHAQLALDLGSILAAADHPGAKGHCVLPIH